MSYECHGKMGALRRVESYKAERVWVPHCRFQKGEVLCHVGENSP